ncbi:MAG: 2-amino-4-hydroxy-6-hydroxymethyldihydropteridine diphosphokinase [Marivirga sp.]|nr:2-amino-4-hydroxy-6-hydroxymethyldihydropteridine diphosphokinase [Marivirga sp.]
MHTGIFLLLGTNIGDRNKNLGSALHAIDDRAGTVKKKSAVYQTEAWGKTDQPSFYNQVVEIETALDPSDLLHEILSIEKKMGRQRKEKWGERIIDIDILFFGVEIIEQTNLNIPHPQLANRRFTLVPLNELIPDFIHPVLGKKISELLAECNDPLEVVKLI